MFTGLIQEVGTIESITQNAEGKEFVIRAPGLISEIAIDDSVATNGVCLNGVRKISGESFRVQVDPCHFGEVFSGSFKSRLQGQS